VNDLKGTHQEYERISTQEWASAALDEKKREIRQKRQRCALEIEVVLADQGESELVETIQKMPFDQRIETLEQFIVRVSRPPAKA
jgi:hypothetical protein